MNEHRVIKFYLDESVNKAKKEKILQFLNECQTVENKLLEHYWNNFNIVLNSKTWIDFCYDKFHIREPRLKSHHYTHVLKQVYEQLKSIQSNIINNKLKFKFENNMDIQKVYNYCSGFCFDWNRLEKYISKQIKSYKKKDNKYYNFLTEVNNYIQNEELYNKLKEDIESKFWEVKNSHKQPIKKEFQIRCNSLHTVDIELKEFQWIFTIDNNTMVGGTEKKPVFDTMIIPVKYSKYHKRILKDKKLLNTFNIKLNKYNKIEIIGCYEIEVEYPKNEIQDVIGIDIGLKKLITCSDGEIIDQNYKIINKLKKLQKYKSNRKRLEAHLQKKCNNEDYRLGNHRYLLRESELSNFIKCDNRYRIKQFLNGRDNDHIIMEDLSIGYSRTKSKQVNYLLKRMRIQNIKDDITKYTKAKGIKLSLINSAFTSQQCAICGFISKENRKTQEKFCCVRCGHMDNADHNASENIKNRYYDNRITLDTPYWRVKEILNVVDT